MSTYASVDGIETLEYNDVSGDAYVIPGKFLLWWSELVIHEANRILDIKSDGDLLRRSLSIYGGLESKSDDDASDLVGSDDDNELEKINLDSSMARIQ